MAAPLSPRRPAEDPNRIASKQRFADKGEVRRKWLKEYGSIEEDGNYRHNKECLSELFNLLDFVTDNALQGYLQQSTYLGLRDDGQERWLYHGPEGDRELNFRPPVVYSSRVYALNQFLGSGHLPRGVNKDVRELRNDMTHVNATVMADQYRLDMDSLWQPLYDIGTALFQLGMLDRRDIVPSFDSLRVQPGSELRNGKYEVCELIGEGGMSRVWRGRQQDAYLVRDVAIKELKPDHYVKETIRNECAVMIRLKHSHIPVIYDAFSQNGTYYIVMELIHGETLSSYLRTHRLTAEQRDRIADGLCDVLSYLHSAGQAFVYADLKPDNILIGPTGDPYLIDFGISRTQGGGKSPRYISPKWSAPEVLDGRPADRRADVYALGKVLSEVYQPAASPALRDVLDVCTAEDPNRRFESVRAVSTALKAARGQPPAPLSVQGTAPLQGSLAAPQRQTMISQPAAARKQPSTTSRKKQMTAVITLLCLIILLASGLLLFLLRDPGSTPEPHREQIREQGGHLAYNYYAAGKETALIEIYAVRGDDNGRPCIVLECTTIDLNEIVFGYKSDSLNIVTLYDKNGTATGPLLLQKIGETDSSPHEIRVSNYDKLYIYVDEWKDYTSLTIDHVKLDGVDIVTMEDLYINNE